MSTLVIGLLFFIPGVAFFPYVLFKYSDEEHQKELEKWRWFRDWDLALFTKIAEKSFY
ncbi:hypothetical protein SAMN05444673_4366 [Bacillus sp. OV166]|uniref:hypothetical protein n=1 Tax=Bacillus sp. OV166 TaxID=1882763 RepID=UPI000A2AAFB7|nr:hypothetical protein [Bacillus sp. OV166]SMQ81534.1 hypothetical protein SAMN05444673_4366 [Bacillus sp. OV166]